MLDLILRPATVRDEQPEWRRIVRDDNEAVSEEFAVVGWIVGSEEKQDGVSGAAKAMQPLTEAPHRRRRRRRK